mmetsp:Transcript_33006/g.32712  ORF Transcript_33006/g.32712 Transcript_33006/m.32712 type:complete len:288 (+) Transcript_33006:14-877(+)
MQTNNLTLRDDITTDNPTQMIATLQAYKEQSVAAGNFLEAEKAVEQIQKLKIQEQKLKEKELLQKQKKEVEQVEFGHLEEFQEFNSLWEEEFDKYKQECKLQLMDLEKTHSSQLEEKQKEAEEKIKIIHKPCSKKLNLMKAKEIAIKQEQYKLAHDLTQEIKILEEEELEKAEAERKIKIEKFMEKVVKQQKVEYEMLKNRLKRNYEELKRRRGMEMERVIKHAQNNKKELERVQGHEKVIAKGRLNSPLSWTMNESTSISRILQTSKSGTPGISVRRRANIDTSSN